MLHLVFERALRNFRLFLRNPSQILFLLLIPFNPNIHRIPASLLLIPHQSQINHPPTSPQKKNGPEQLTPSRILFGGRGTIQRPMATET